MTSSKFIKIFLRVLMLVLLCFAGYWCYLAIRYYLALDSQNKEWIEQEFKPKIIKGTVKSFQEDGDNGNTFHILLIKNNNETVSYGLVSCEENKSFREFISVGDSIIKDSMSLKIIIIKKTVAPKEFGLIFCNN